MIFFPTLEKLAKVKKVNFIFGGIVVSTATLCKEGPEFNSWVDLSTSIYVCISWVFWIPPSKSCILGSISSLCVYVTTFSFVLTETPIGCVLKH